jgi:antitoxin component of RelBE/YafQ-DinJ toxin-antitoxin module
VKKNITISVDSAVIDRARAVTARQGRTVTDAVREYLLTLGAEEQDRTELSDFFAQMEVGTAGRRFTRDEMNER